LKKLEASGVAVRPGSLALIAAQDKIVMREKLQALGAPLPLWAVAHDQGDVEGFLAQVSGAEVVAKTPRGGYDGKGVRFISDATSVDDWLGEVELNGRVFIPEEDLRPLVRWAHYSIEVGEKAISMIESRVLIAGDGAGDGAGMLRFPEPRRGLSPKATCAREILVAEWPRTLTGAELANKMKPLKETPAHIADRIIPELREAGCPVENSGRGYQLVPVGSIR
jgi:hypothetical protein